MEIRRNTVVRFLYSRGRLRQAGRAQQELPDRFDSEQQQQLLQDLGVDAGTIERSFPPPTPIPAPTSPMPASAASPVEGPKVNRRSDWATLESLADTASRTTADPVTSAAERDLTWRALRTWLSDRDVPPSAPESPDTGVLGMVFGPAVTRG
ncbi:hypothetical protein SAMN04515671_3170 [Nakamurella panacisegetis]|uniref:Uncharacterized protein n=1 Tax=Nakamurella panacisegetis TaxID=1090615 RepID=A0A1H0QMW1_9ACTN|nr:hypothetical protein SAMN04515671_3170 [Nakamurella panacisegetis]